MSQPKTSKKVIYIVQGFETKLAEGNLVDIATIEVYANTEEEALERARQYVKKSYYRVSHVIEK